MHSMKINTACVVIAMCNLSQTVNVPLILSQYEVTCILVCEMCPGCAILHR